MKEYTYPIQNNIFERNGVAFNINYIIFVKKEDTIVIAPTEYSISVVVTLRTIPYIVNISPSIHYKYNQALRDADYEVLIQALRERATKK